MNRVNVIARIAHPNAVALALVQMERRRRHHLVHGIRHAVEGKVSTKAPIMVATLQHSPRDSEILRLVSRIYG